MTCRDWLRVSLRRIGLDPERVQQWVRRVNGDLSVDI